MNVIFRRFSAVFLLILLLNSFSNAQVVGSKFPQMETSTADGKEVELPQDTKGKYTLLGLAFSKKSEGDLNSWMEPIFWKFIDKPSGKMNQLFGSHQYDVNAYFVPMFTGIKTAATKTAKKKAVKKLDPRLIPSILFYKGKLKPFRESLDFQQKDIPYFFVLDREGKIVFATSGKYSEEKMSQIEEIVGE